MVKPTIFVFGPAWFIDRIDPSPACLVGFAFRHPVTIVSVTARAFESHLACIDLGYHLTFIRSIPRRAS